MLEEEMKKHRKDGKCLKYSQFHNMWKANF